MEMGVNRENTISKGEINQLFWKQSFISLLKSMHFYHYWHLFTNPWKSRLYYIAWAFWTVFLISIISSGSKCKGCICQTHDLWTLINHRFFQVISFLGKEMQLKTMHYLILYIYDSQSLLFIWRTLNISPNPVKLF